MLPSPQLDPLIAIEHVGLDVVLNILRPREKRIMRVLSGLLAVGIVGLFLYAVAQNAWVSYRNHEAIAGTVELRIWPVKFLMVIGLVFFFFQVLINLTSKTKPPYPLKKEPHL